jgi:hypothetical protein
MSEKGLPRRRIQMELNDDIRFPWMVHLVVDVPPPVRRRPVPLTRWKNKEARRKGEDARLL